MERVMSLPDNAMIKVRPDLWDEWDFERNSARRFKYDIYKMTFQSGKTAWWICKDCGNNWSMTISERVNGKGCTECNKHKKRIPFTIGVNDLKTTNPKEYEWLKNKKDGDKATKSSTKKVDWICPDCNSVVKNKSIYTVTKHGLSCTNCSDGISYPEKVMYHVLKELNVDFIYNSTFKWSGLKRYDFYIDDLKCIIETHGQQHYEEGFEFSGSRSLQEEQDNDKLKYELAMSNKIKKYIVIDCRHSDIEWIRNNILKSELAELYDLSCIDWLEIGKKASKSRIFEACELWNSGIRSTNEIAKIMTIHFSTVINYLHKGRKLGITDYDPKRNNKAYFKKVMQISLDYEETRLWHSLNEVCDVYDYDRSNFRTKCQKGEIYDGSIWIYQDEYIKRLKIK